MTILKECKLLAKKYLGRKGNWLRLIIAAVLLVFTVMSPMVLAMSISGILAGDAPEGSTLYVISDVVFYVLWVVLGLTLTPIGIACFYRFAYLGYKNGRDGISENGRLLSFGRSLGAGLLILLRILPVIALFVAVYWLGFLSDWWLYLPLAIAAIWLAIPLMGMSGSVFLFPYYVARGERIGDACRMSRRAMKGNRRLYFSYMLSFLGWVLLSLLTAGVLLLIYVLPVMCFTYFILADRLDAQITPEETNR